MLWSFMERRLASAPYDTLVVLSSAYTPDPPQKRARGSNMVLSALGPDACPLREAIKIREEMAAFGNWKTNTPRTPSFQSFASSSSSSLASSTGEIITTGLNVLGGPPGDLVTLPLESWTDVFSSHLLAILQQLPAGGTISVEQIFRHILKAYETHTFGSHSSRRPAESSRHSSWVGAAREREPYCGWIQESGECGGEPLDEERMILLQRLKPKKKDHGGARNEDFEDDGDVVVVVVVGTSSGSGSGSGSGGGDDDDYVDGEAGEQQEWQLVGPDDLKCRKHYCTYRCAGPGSTCNNNRALY